MSIVIYTGRIRSGSMEIPGKDHAEGRNQKST